MSDEPDLYQLAYWEGNLEELDREVGRLATICRVRLLDRGVIDRVLHGDDSVCAADNPDAFVKLRNLLMVHGMLREKIADRLGQHQTADLESHVIERLRRVFPDLGSDWPLA